MNPCSPEDINRISKLMAEGHLERVEAKTIVESPSELTDDVGATMSKVQSGWFATKYRTMRAMWGPDFTVRVLNPLTQASTKTNNTIARYVNELNDAMLGLHSENPSTLTRFSAAFRTIPLELDRELGRALENISEGGKWMINPSIFSKQVQEVAPKVRNVMDKAFKEFGIDPDKYIHGYLPHVKERPSGLFYHTQPRTAKEQQFINSLNADDLKFYHEYERSGGMLNYETRASQAINQYLHSAARYKILRPAIKQAEREYVNDFFGVKFLKLADTGEIKVLTSDRVGYNTWREYQHYLLGGPTAADVQNAANMNRFLTSWGKNYQTDTRGVMAFSNLISNMFYMGVLGSPLGGRPASIVRQLGQLVPSFAEFGTIRMSEAIGALAKHPQELAAKYEKMGVLTSHIDQLVSSLETARGLGRAVSASTDYSLKIFGAVDRYVRVATAYAAEKRFDDFLSEGRLDRIPGAKELKQEVKRLVADGRTQEARERYIMENLSLLQYSYGRANRPEKMRSMLGNWAGMLTSYPLNTFELMNSLTQRAIHGVKHKEWENVLPLARMIGLSIAIPLAGSEFLDADLRSVVFTSAMPHSLAFPKAVGDIYNLGAYNLEWLTGNAYQVGETDYHKKLRMENYRNVMRDVASFIPFTGFAHDVNKIVDEGSLLSALAMTPKGDVLNEMRKQKAKETRADAIREQGVQPPTGLNLEPIR